MAEYSDDLVTTTRQLTKGEKAIINTKKTTNCAKKGNVYSLAESSVEFTSNTVNIGIAGDRDSKDRQAFIFTGKSIGNSPYSNNTRKETRKMLKCSIHTCYLWIRK